MIPAVIVLASLLFFAAVWSGVNALLAWASGWRALAERYRCPEGLRGAALASGFANRVGFVSHRGTLGFEACPQGLIARVMPLFLFHPPLLIPWHAVRLQPVSGLFAAGQLTVPEGQSFTLNRDALGSIGHALAAHALPGAGAARLSLSRRGAG